MNQCTAKFIDFEKIEESFKNGIVENPWDPDNPLNIREKFPSPPPPSPPPSQSPTQYDGEVTMGAKKKLYSLPLVSSPDNIGSTRMAAHRLTKLHSQMERCRLKQYPEYCQKLDLKGQDIYVPKHLDHDITTDILSAKIQNDKITLDDNYAAEISAAYYNLTDAADVPSYMSLIHIDACLSAGLAKQNGCSELPKLCKTTKSNFCAPIYYNEHWIKSLNKLPEDQIFQM